MTDVSLNSVLTVVSDVYRSMAHIEPIAANAVATACAEIGERLRAGVVITQAPVRSMDEMPELSRTGRRRADHTVRIESLEVGQGVELTMVGDPREIFNLRTRIESCIRHLRKRRPDRRFSRRTIDGGYLVARLA